MVESFLSLAAPTDERTEVYVLNLPDRLLPEQLSYFISRNGFLSEVRFRQDRRVTPAYFGQFQAIRKYPLDWSFEWPRFLYCEVLALTARPDVLVLAFDEKTERLEPWDPVRWDDLTNFMSDCHGIYEPEGSAAGGRQWQWTNGDTTITLALACYEDLRIIKGISMRLAGPSHMAQEAVIGVFDEAPVRVRLAPGIERQCEILFSEKTRETIAREGAIVLRIQSKPWRPSDRGFSSDRRVLGVYVASLKFVTDCTPGTVPNLWPKDRGP
jgi:hypothetical protein